MCLYNQWMILTSISVYESLIRGSQQPPRKSGCHWIHDVCRPFVQQAVLVSRQQLSSAGSGERGVCYLHTPLPFIVI